jgi:cell division protein YceG involved in septum cleavage
VAEPADTATPVKAAVIEPPTDEPAIAGPLASDLPASELPLPEPPAPEPPASELPPFPSALPSLRPHRPHFPRRPHAPRRGPARVLALLALVAVVAAVVLVVRALVHHSSSKPVAAPKVIRLVIPEGETRAQIAEIAKADHLTGSYRGASKRSPLLDPVHYGAPRGTPYLEGFLFPATYDMNPGEPVRRLVEKQLLAFRENFGASEIRRARALHVTPYQLLTVASMIEREAQMEGDRPKIAAVIYNRLRNGIPLGIDATIYYAVELQKGIATYTGELTEAQLHSDSPYNTRLHKGLPPTPISNPGLASIQAAAHPAHVPYLYYVAGADGCGEQVFSSTAAQFEKDVASYREAVKKNGGKPPACKKK